mgnify:CR=1 FL=1
MEMLVHVSHVSHNARGRHECPCHNHYGQVEIPIWVFFILGYCYYNST